MVYGEELNLAARLTAEGQRPKLQVAIVCHRKGVCPHNLKSDTVA